MLDELNQNNQGQQDQKWFVGSYSEAVNEFNSTGGLLPIASPIYPESRPDTSDNFPYKQIIRGDGACFLNASMVGILSKCVNNDKRWETFKNNIERLYGSGEVLKKINFIYEQCKQNNKNCLDRQKLYQLLSHKGNDNPITQLVKAILIPKHKNLIQYYEARILDTKQKIDFEEATKITFTQEELESSNSKIKVLKNAIKLYSQYKEYIEKADSNFATSYEEGSLTHFVSELTAGMGRQGEPLTVLTICADNIEIYGNILDIDEDKIYLYNHDGRSHFNLWFSKKDPICQELAPQVKLLQETKTRDQKDQSEKFNELKNEISNSMSLIDIQVVNEILDSSTLDDLEFNQENLLKLDLLKSIIDAKDANSQTKLKKEESLQKPEINKSESEIDPEICYQLALEEIVNNDQPSEIFTTYLNVIKKQDSKKPQERTLAHIVAIYGKEKFLEPILEILPTSFGEKDRIGDTPLISAISKAKNKFAQTLLENMNKYGNIGILNIDYISNNGNNAIHLACIDSHKKDSSKGLDEISNAKLVKKLIDVGADPNIISALGLSALDVAVLRGSEEMVEAILNSSKIQSSTILNAIGYTEKNNQQQQDSLKTIPTPNLKVIDKTHNELLASIKELLEKKLNEIDPEYALNKAIRNSIQESYIKKPKGTQPPELCDDFKDLLINPQDNNFNVYDKNKSIIEFKNISPFFGANKENFNYNKLLDKDSQFNPSFYNKEKEQGRIIEALQQAKEVTIKRYSSENLSHDFFVAVMKVASINYGIGNITEEKFKEDLKKALRDDAFFQSHKNDKELHNIAKFFSKTFQDISEKDGYLTARKKTDGTINKTPRRLFRVCTKENIDQFAKAKQKTQPQANDLSQATAGPLSPPPKQQKP
ncbi:hypothetical protein LBMAG18_03800 [Alphaproteobacteria bacterium]|nr:hypothetical protein LBMAG18_03800 [Alphaproteobacteria bacterium]